jgi:hypothetical protein
MSRIAPPRAQWLGMLAKLTAPTEAGEAAQALMAYLPFLSQFPDAAFTTASLEHVASQCRRGAPAYGEIRDHLASWWKENRPLHTAIAPPLPPQRRAPTTDELEAVSSIVARGIADIEANYERVYHAKKPEERPKARHLTRTELNAAYAKDGLKGPAVPS